MLLELYTVSAQKIKAVKEKDPVSAKILQLVGEGKRVLSLGRAHGDLLRGL